MQFLDQQALEELTGRKRPSAQLKWLQEEAHIPAILRADGTVLVLWSAVEAKLGVSQAQQKRRIEPDWDALNAPKEAQR